MLLGIVNMMLILTKSFSLFEQPGLKMTEESSYRLQLILQIASRRNSCLINYVLIVDLLRYCWPIIYYVTQDIFPATS